MNDELTKARVRILDLENQLAELKEHVVDQAQRHLEQLHRARMEWHEEKTRALELRAENDSLRLGIKELLKLNPEVHFCTGCGEFHKGPLCY